jgi:hypothetical protein
VLHSSGGVKGEGEFEGVEGVLHILLLKTEAVDWLSSISNFRTRMYVTALVNNINIIYNFDMFCFFFPFIDFFSLFYVRADIHYEEQLSKKGQPSCNLIVYKVPKHFLWVLH